MSVAHAEAGDATAELIAALLMLGPTFTIKQFRDTRTELGITSSNLKKHKFVVDTIGSKGQILVRYVTEAGKQFLLNYKEK